MGPLLEPNIVRLHYQRPKRLDDGDVVGSITHVEVPFGNVVTNIPKSLVDAMGLSPADNAAVFVEISQAGAPVFPQRIPHAPSFGHVDEGAPLLYSDSLQTIGLAINSGDFAQQYQVQAGADWMICISK